MYKYIHCNVCLIHGLLLGFIFKYCYLFIFSCVGSLLLCGLFPSCREQGLLTAVASLAVAPRLWSTGSTVVVQGSRCSMACGILLDQGLNPCLLYWQTSSLSLSHQGSPWWRQQWYLCSLPRPAYIRCDRCLFNEKKKGTFHGKTALYKSLFPGFMHLFSLQMLQLDLRSR